VVGGIFDTPYGPLTLQVEGNRVSGHYPGNEGRIEGTLDGLVMTGTWAQTDGRGRFRFTFAPDGQSFTGTWGSGQAEPISPGWDATRRN
jgi:hypothetical protein